MKIRRSDQRDLRSLLVLNAAWWTAMLTTGALGPGLWWAFKTAGVLTVASVSTVSVIYLRRDR